MTAPSPGDLFFTLEPLQLAGSRCRHCHTVQFPVAAQCAHCASDAVEAVMLPSEGRLWTWTVQRFAPKAPYVQPKTGFEPFAVGYVDLGVVLVESVIRADLSDLRVGLPVRLVGETLVAVDDRDHSSAHGDPDTLTFAFAG